MSRLDDLQTTAQQLTGDTDLPLGGLQRLQADNDTTVQEAVA